MSITGHLLDLLYPPACYGCDAPAQADFCASCAAAIRLATGGACPLCGHPIATLGSPDRICGRCLLDRPAFDRARAAVLLDSRDDCDPVRTALHRYKYGRDVALAVGLGRLLVAAAAGQRHDLIVPVPLHRERLRWRGFNQALLLARRLGRAADTSVDFASLVRSRPTAPQVDLDEGARRRNVAGAFAVARPQHIVGRRVLLVDDVLTTGSTVNECSRALRRAGAAGVEVLVVARAVRS